MRSSSHSLLSALSRCYRLPAVASLLLVALWAAPGRADVYSGTVQYPGQVTFAVPIPGIGAENLTVSVDEETEATEGGEKCEIFATVSDSPDPAGAYPDAGQVSADMEISAGGGPKLPEGQCVVKLVATGTDGVSVSARGSQTVFVQALEIDSGATVPVPDIVVRQSKAVAGVDRDCQKWVKKQLKLRAKCNFLLLKKGPAAAIKCKDAGLDPADCDPGEVVEAILALSHGPNDQQTDPPSGELIDAKALKDQLKCQKHFGFAAAGFVAKRIKFVDEKCVLAGLDSDSCRDTQTNDTKKKLDRISKCSVDQASDGSTGRKVPDLGAPCDVCIDGLGSIDTKCIRSCFEITVAELTEGIIGDVPECGNGITQPGEFCDDGNTTSGDCCSDSCTAESLGDQTCGVGACEVTVPLCQLGEPVTCVPGTPGTEGPNGDPTCTDGVDNDCDGDTDGVDTDCLP